MKKFLPFFFCILCIGSIQSHAQDLNHHSEQLAPDNFHIPFNNISTQDLYEDIPCKRLDSVKYFFYNYERERIESSKSIFLYDSLGNLIKSSYLNKDGENQFVVTNETEGYYEEESGATVSISRIANSTGDSLIFDQKSEVFYNNFGMQTKAVIYKYDTDQKAWVYYSNNETSYMQDTLISEFLIQFWNSDADLWKNHTRYLYTYNEQGKKLTESNQRWMENSGDWWEQNRTENTYDPQQNLIQEVFIIFDYNDEMNVSKLKVAHVYDNMPEVMIDTIYQYLAFLDRWTILKVEIDSLNNGLIDNSSVMRWSSQNDEWYAITRLEYMYDNENRIIQETKLIGNMNSDSYENSEREIYSYQYSDKQYNTIAPKNYLPPNHFNKSSYNWISNTMEFRVIDELELYFSDFMMESKSDEMVNPGSENIIYPNPSSGTIIISSTEDLENTKLRIMNMNGAEIYVGEAKTMMHLDGIDNGVYILVLEKANTIVYRDIILIQR